jgi:transcriptional regulator with XRE-family HTH domain
MAQGHHSRVGVRRTTIDEAGRRARRQLDEVIRDLRDARLAAGLPQVAVAQALRVSRQAVSLWESGDGAGYTVQLARWGAAVGLDVSIRTFVAGSPLRDAGQLRVLRRARSAIGERWVWRTEVPVSNDPRDRRAFDAVLWEGRFRIGLEVITRLTDAQAQTRAALLKQEVAGLDRMVLVLAQTRRNRAALASASPTLMPSFPMTPRAVLGALRAGRRPAANGIVLV